MVEECLWRQRFAAHPEQLKHVREALMRCLKATDFPASQVDRIVLAVNEACMNVIQHAYANEPGEMLLQVGRCTATHWVFRLTDFAAPVCLQDLRPRRLRELRPGGLGVHFMRAVMDRIRLEHPADEQGNILIMEKFI